MRSIVKFEWLDGDCFGPRTIILRAGSSRSRVNDG